MSFAGSQPRANFHPVKPRDRWTGTKDFRRWQKYFEVISKDGSTLDADFVCISCGGYHKADQYKWLSRLGHTFEPPVPSLFTFNVPQNPISKLMGVSQENVTVKINGTKLSQTGPVLITHWGFSGPAILKLSAFGAKELSK